MTIYFALGAFFACLWLYKEATGIYAKRQQGIYPRLHHASYPLYFVGIVIIWPVFAVMIIHAALHGHTP